MQKQNEPQNKKQISRRDMIKAAGVLSLGLMYTKPFVEKIQAQPALVGSGIDPGPNCPDPNDPRCNPA
jgi:hypothetical protein